MQRGAKDFFAATAAERRRRSDGGGAPASGTEERARRWRADIRCRPAGNGRTPAHGRTGSFN